MSVIKGQNLRLKVNNKVVAAATACTIHESATLEDTSTKDSTDSWTNQEVTGKAWDISTDALVVIDSTEEGLTAFDALDLVGTEVDVEFGVASGTENRTIAKKYSGKVIVNDVSISASNKQNATYSLQAQGNGALTKATA